MGAWYLLKFTVKNFIKHMRTKYYLQCIFLCVTFLTNAQTMLESADELVKKEEWKEACIILERIIFDSSSPEIRNLSAYKKAFCYKQLAEFEKAQRVMESINYSGLNDNLSFKYRYESALCAYLAGNFNDAESQIIQINNFISDSTSKQSALFLEVLILNELRKWDQSAKKIVELISIYSPPEIKDSLLYLASKMYQKKSIPKLKKQSTAKVLSFIPGLGQVYAGYFLEGTDAFLLNLAFLGFGVYQVYEGFYLTGYFIGAGGLSKTFFGNMRYAEFLVEKHNYNKSREFNDKVSAFIFQNIKYPFDLN